MSKGFSIASKVAGAIIILIIAFRLFFASKPARAAFGGILWDPISEARLQDLHPAIQKAARQFINAAEAEGIKLRISDAFRTFEEQDKLYMKGREVSESIFPDWVTFWDEEDENQIVTNAKGGESYHNYGLAFDVVEMIDGQPNYETPNWSKIGQLGRSFGFVWGGDWNFKDRPHFEMAFGLSTDQLYSMSISQNTNYPLINA